MNRFNAVKQSRDYDPDGDFLRFWIPELADCPAAVIHEPWLMTDQQQARGEMPLLDAWPCCRGGVLWSEGRRQTANIGRQR